MEEDTTTIGQSIVMRRSPNPWKVMAIGLEVMPDHRLGRDRHNEAWGFRFCKESIGVGVT